MKRMKQPKDRRITPLLRLQYKLQETRLTNAGVFAYMDSIRGSETGSFYSTRFR